MAPNRESLFLDFLINSDDAKYVLILFSSLFLGFVIKQITVSWIKQAASFFIGFVGCIVFCGFDSVHFIVCVIVNTFIIFLISPRFCHLASFFWAFSYLLFFRLTSIFGLPKPLALSNAVQLILTLKMTSLGFEIHDTHDKRMKRTSNAFQDISPSIWDCFSYCFCFIGIMTGPFYKFRTYQDMVKHREAWRLPTFDVITARIKLVPVYLLGFLILSSLFPVELMKSGQLYERPFWFRLFYMVPMFVIFRLRFYIAWVLAECMCISSGLGAYPEKAKAKPGQGPTDLEALAKCAGEPVVMQKYDFQSIHNITEWDCEMSPTVRGGMKAWNRTVQYWMAWAVYSRIPANRFVRTLITMNVSAFWHGIHPGYYLSLTTVPLWLAAEDAMSKAYRPFSAKVYDWVSWFFKMRAFDYMCIGFLMLTYTDTVRYWHSIYFILHILCLFFILLGNLSYLVFKRFVFFKTVPKND